MEDRVRVFDKSLYAGDPPAHIQQVIEKLAVLGPAVVAVRGPGFSANILGTLYIGKDGDDPVLRGEGGPPDECTCHIHIMWDRVRDYTFAREDVGYGPDAVIYLLGEDGEPIVNIFYPGRTFEEIEALLTSVSTP